MKRTEKHNLATRTRLLDVAEKLFSERGFEATSVRDITQAADCSNVAAINYYFGGKEQLYEICLLNLFRDLREWRSERIRTEMAAFGENPAFEDFLLVFVQSFLDELGDEERRQRLDAFIDREIRSAHLHPARFNEELIQPVRELTTVYLSGLASGLEQNVIELCIEFLMGHLVHSRRLRDQLRQGRHRVLIAVDERKFVNMVVTFAAAGIRACVAQSTMVSQPRD